MIKGTKFTRIKLKSKAIQLRKKGLSYKEILQQIPASKSTISLWVREVALTKEQTKRLCKKKDSQQRGLHTIHKSFWVKRCAAFNDGLKTLKKYDSKPDFIAGLMLYWGEGTKKKNTIFTNSDKNMVLFMVNWFKKYYHIPASTMTASLNLHTGQNENKIITFWSKITGIPKDNFKKSFIKPEGTGHKKNILYNGTVKIRVKGQGSTYLLFKILGSLAGYIYKSTGEKIIPENWMTKSTFAD